MNDFEYWAHATVAGRRLRLWADPAAGRVLIQTDSLEPVDVGRVEGLGCGDIAVTLEFDADTDLAEDLVEFEDQVWRAALRVYNEAEWRLRGRRPPSASSSGST